MKRFVEEAVERMTARRPKAITNKNSGVCPNCESLVHRYEDDNKEREVLHCKWCGQKLNWED